MYGKRQPVSGRQSLYCNMCRVFIYTPENRVYHFRSALYFTRLFFLVEHAQRACLRVKRRLKGTATRDGMCYCNWLLLAKIRLSDKLCLVFELTAKIAEFKEDHLKKIKTSCGSLFKSKSPLHLVRQPLYCLD